jgi:Flp pilus assembly protein TadD
MSTRAHPSNPPPPGPAEAPPKKRRTLADGPAVREALALAEQEAKKNDGGWKLLEGPPQKQAQLPARQPSSPRLPPPPVRKPSPPRVPAQTAPAERPAAEPVTVRAVAPVAIVNVAAVAPPIPVAPIAPPPLAFTQPIAPPPPAVVEPIAPPPPAVAEPIAPPPPPPPAVAAPIGPIPSAALLAELSPPAALDESALRAAGLAKRPRRSLRIAHIAVAGVGVGIALGLAVLLLALSKRAPADEHAPIGKTTANARAAEPAPPPAATAAPVPPAPEIAATPGSAVIPWDDLPAVKAASCEELAAADVQGSNPKSVALERALKEAPRALMRGDAPAAHRAFCVATQLGRRSPTMLSGLSQTLLVLSDPHAALATTDQLLQLDPTSWAALDLRGDVLIRMGRVEEAKSSWFTAAGVSPASEPLVRNLLRANKSAAEAALRAGDLPRADRMLRRVIALTPMDAAPCLQLAALLAKSGQQAAAERWRAYAGSLAS